MEGRPPPRTPLPRLDEAWSGSFVFDGCWEVASDEEKEMDLVVVGVVDRTERIEAAGTTELGRCGRQCV